ncbi:MAG: hypothetical protein N2Z23_09060 [Pyrinomonadaceae bacterium]|nr:hypothetical protein [Pyrinomonadaceae bacterium]MCX7640570.1 hypothetical protein [Pyrinomonadaceae bacterium]MDW8303849.1 hypothetical protein [Acidobacteriota bacterium]
MIINLETSCKSWQVTKVALAFPILEESFTRDFFLLKPYLADRSREVKGLVPVFGAGAMADQEPPVSVGQPEKAGYKYADLKCSSIAHSS